jgi:hypothetical protein
VVPLIGHSFVCSFGCACLILLGHPCLFRVHAPAYTCACVHVRLRVRASACTRALGRSGVAPAVPWHCPGTDSARGRPV